MVKRGDHEPLRTGRTRLSSLMVSLTIAVIFLVLLIVFIAQNERTVPLHFLGASGNVSEALAIVASAVAGAVLVLAIAVARVVQLRLVLSVGVARIIQLRVGGRRHNREVARQQQAAAKADAADESQASAPPPPEGESQAVETED